MKTYTEDATTIRTRLTDEEIAERIAEVNAYDLFSVFTFNRAAAHSDEFMGEALTIISKDGSEYAGYVEDWDDSKMYVNLK